MFLQDDEIERLITCPKEITKKPRRNMRREGRHLRNDFDCAEFNGPALFHVFMRQHADFSENFSVGLNYSPVRGGETECLFRCNGPHGEQRTLPNTPPHHFSHHIHRATEDAFASGFRAESRAEVTEVFATFEEAFVYFVNSCSILEAEKFFPFLGPERGRQLRLFREEDE